VSNPTQNSAVEQWLEKKFGVSITAIGVTDAAIASGEIPDFFSLGNNTLYSAYQRQGVLMEVNMNEVKQRVPEYYDGVVADAPWH